MVSATILSPVFSGTARRVRTRTTNSPDFAIMTTVVCEDCGEHFQITHAMRSQDEALARRQARWLVDRLVWDHIQESKHRSSVDLPALAARQA